MMGSPQARQHPIRFNKPAPNFFEGALMGNGGLGVVITTRPDAIVLHLGHNNVWDIRVAEKHVDEVGTFREVFGNVRAIDPNLTSLQEDPWYKQYRLMTIENYDAPYPRPMPCGSVLLGFDRREVEVLGHTLWIDSGLCEIDLLWNGETVTLEVFTDHRQDNVWMRLCDREKRTMNNAIFDRIRLIPDPETPKDFPTYQTALDLNISQISFEQILPVSSDPSVVSSKDKTFRVGCRLFETTRPKLDGAKLEMTLDKGDPFIVCVGVIEGLRTNVSKLAWKLPTPKQDSFEAAQRATRQAWDDYWSRSAVALEDDVLERTWYWNLYFLNCSVRPDVSCPGLFANWSYASIGSAWHGDYHMNYNTQQPFWCTFSTNHVDKHLPYVDLVHHMLPISQKWARTYYGLRGAYFPHSAYPTEMNIMPYPSPDWGWEVCETPWSVQSLWWHYLYTMDREYLESKAFVPIKEAVLFMVDYMNRGDAHGEAFGDDKYHIFPTVVPELYGLTPGFRMNADCLVDLTLTKFLFRAFLTACDVLQRRDEEHDLRAQVTDILAHFPEYATAPSPRGPVFVSVYGESPETIYNLPNSIMTVFPGEEHGLDSSTDIYNIAVNSFLNHRNEGGNDLVMYNMVGARLGKLDLERFKRQIEYCLLPNGSCTDRVLLSGGRYRDTTDFDFMSKMGIWFENFSLPAVIDECLMQSYTGVVRLFPNWPTDKQAEFHTLRAVGGFLVSAKQQHGQVRWVEVISETGELLRLMNPWRGKPVRCIVESQSKILDAEVLIVPTVKGQSIRFEPMDENYFRA